MILLKGSKEEKDKLAHDLLLYNLKEKYVGLGNLLEAVSTNRNAFPDFSENFGTEESTHGRML